VARTGSRLPRRAPELSPGNCPQGRGKEAARCQRAKDGPSGNPPVKVRSAGEKRQRAAFLLDTFLWRSKEKYLAFGGETPIQVSVAAATP
jgi:hypothetical protein